MTIELYFRMKKTSKLGVEYTQVSSVIYQDVQGYTFETIKELDNEMCVVLHFGDGERATWECKNVVGIESRD